MQARPIPAPGVPPRTPGCLNQDKGNEIFTFLGETSSTVQGGIPMTVQGKGAALPPCKRPEARLPALRPAFMCPAFILALNIPAGGSHGSACAGCGA